MKKATLLGVMLAIAGTAFGESEPITQTPEGTVKKYMGFSFTCQPFYGWVDQWHEDGYARDIVFAEDGAVYFQNPFVGLNIPVWIKGTLAEGVITVETPQTLGVFQNEDGEADTYYLRRLKEETRWNEEWEEWEEVWVPDEENTQITFNYAENGTISMTEDDVMLGMSKADGEHSGYGENNIVYTPFNDAVTEIPEGVVMEKWNFKYKYVSDLMSRVYVGFDGDDVYIKGFSTTFPEVVFKGKISGDKLIIASGQYVGDYTSEGGSKYYRYLMHGEHQGGMGDDYEPLATPVELAYDAEARTMSGTDEDHLIIKNGKSTGYICMDVVDYLSNPRYYPFTVLGNPATPGNTFNVTLNDAACWIQYTLPLFDVNDNALPVEDMSWSVWLDEALYIFEPDSYSGLEEATTEIPATFNNGDNIWYKLPSFPKVFIYDLGFDAIGVQTHYTDPETGEKLSSAICYKNPTTGEKYILDPSSVKSAITDAAVESVETYDVNGMRVSGDYKGLVIKVVRYSDGTSKTVKAIMK